MAPGGSAGHSDQHYPSPLPQAVWPSDIHIVSNGIPNYEYPPWALVVYCVGAGPSQCFKVTKHEVTECLNDIGQGRGQGL